jgi:hypothetical protein
MLLLPCITNAIDDDGHACGFTNTVDTDDQDNSAIDNRGTCAAAEGHSMVPMIFNSQRTRPVKIFRSCSAHLKLCQPEQLPEFIKPFCLIISLSSTLYFATLLGKSEYFWVFQHTPGLT